MQMMSEVMIGETGLCCMHCDSCSVCSNHDVHIYIVIFIANESQIALNNAPEFKIKTSEIGDEKGRKLGAYFPDLPVFVEEM